MLHDTPQCVAVNLARHRVQLCQARARRLLQPEAEVGDGRAVVVLGAGAAASRPLLQHALGRQLGACRLENINVCCKPFDTNCVYLYILTCGMRAAETGCAANPLSENLRNQKSRVEECGDSLCLGATRPSEIGVCSGPDSSCEDLAHLSARCS